MSRKPIRFDRLNFGDEFADPAEPGVRWCRIQLRLGVNAAEVLTLPCGGRDLGDGQNVGQRRFFDDAHAVVPLIHDPAERRCTEASQAIGSEAEASRTRGVGFKRMVAGGVPVRRIGRANDRRYTIKKRAGEE